MGDSDEQADQSREKTACSSFVVKLCTQIVCSEKSKQAKGRSVGLLEKKTSNSSAFQGYALQEGMMKKTNEQFISRPLVWVPRRHDEESHYQVRKTREPFILPT